MIKHILLSLLLILGGSLTAAEKEPLHTEAELNAAYAYMEAIGTPETLDRTINAILNQQLEKLPELEPYRAVFLAFYRDCLSYEANRQELANLYLKNFTAPELEELTAFARTPLGQKLAKTNAELGEAMSALHTRRLEENQPKLEAALQAAVANQSAI